MASEVRTSSLDLNQSNEEIQAKLGEEVAQQYLGLAVGDRSYRLGSLSENYFSFTFSVNVLNASGETSGVFVKIPKADLRLNESSIFPIKEEDRQLALAEQASLLLLTEQWPKEDLYVRWVKPKGFLKDYNAIVTERVWAGEAFSVFRQWDIRRRLGLRQDATRLRLAMGRLGGALGRFHQTQEQPSVFDIKTELPKLEYYCQKLSKYTTSYWPTRALDIISSCDWQKIKGVKGPTLKGIDIRNVLIDDQDRITLLDPGKCKTTFCEADLARFVMTYRILYWGSSLLLLLGQPDRQAEVAFIDAYCAKQNLVSRQLLSLYLIKEQLKHWHTAMDSLSHLSWPSIMKKWVARIYINPFYINQISREAKRLSNLEQS
jgi:hypothetical protein